MTLAQRLTTIRQRIAGAVQRRGPGPEVHLIGVSKRHPPTAIREAARAGLLDFGENYAQELRDKRRELNPEHPDLRWHFIGSLQRNKAKYVVGCALIHTVDRPALIEVIDSRASRLKQVQSVLVQVKLGQEPQKSGIAPDDLPALLAAFQGRASICCQGLMVIPPLGPPEETRVHFRALRALRDSMATRPLPPNVDLHALSMGMSSDFEVAIEEGATHVRVGTAVFGPRPG